MTIYELRKAKKISISDLSRRTGLSRPCIYQIEKGQSNPTVATIKLIASALGVSVEQILGCVSNKEEEY